MTDITETIKTQETKTTKTVEPCLYLVATPIGNLEDMTYRAVRILQEVDLIAAEDTRNTRKLLSHYDIHTPLTSYHEHNKFTKGPELVKKLQEGLQIAAVSDAGLPGISDPGTHLAQLAIAENIKVSPIPGANAALSALICSGLDTVNFTFIGFLPKTTKKRLAVLHDLKTRKETLIFYETPYHLKNTLKELVNTFGEMRAAATCRELTKKFEEFNRGSLAQLNDYYHENEPRGEFVIIVAGNDNNEEDISSTEISLSPVQYVEKLMNEGIDKKEAMRMTAKALNISRRDVYQALLTK